MASFETIRPTSSSSSSPEHGTGSPGPVFGLVLAGGESRRWGYDKARLDFGHGPHYLHVAHLLSQVTDRVLISRRPGQDPLSGSFPVLNDTNTKSRGPHASLEAAWSLDGAAAWILVACDLPGLEESTVRALRENRSPGKVDAVAYPAQTDPWRWEPLCTLYEPSTRALWLTMATEVDRPSLQALLRKARTVALPEPAPEVLFRCNSPHDWETWGKFSRNR